MRAGHNFKLAGGAKVNARLDLEETGVYILIEDNGHTILLRMTKQLAGRIKDQLSDLDLVTGT